jgi:hypothetical protein
MIFSQAVRYPLGTQFGPLFQIMTFSMNFPNRWNDSMLGGSL